MSTPTIRAALERLVGLHNADGAWGLHWTDAIAAARAALAAEPVGEEPSEEQILLLANDCLGFELSIEEEEDIIGITRAALARWGRPAAPAAPETPAEALAARPLLEQVARLGDCIGANTVGQIMAISSRAAAWLEENPPGQPVAIEPRGCPTPGACSCVEPTPPAPEVGEVGELVEWLEEEAEAYSETFGATLASVNLARAATLLQQLSAPALAVVPVAVSERPWEREGWCGKWGYCWRFDPCENGWWSYGPPLDLMNDPGDWTHMAPHDAIPLPQGGEGK